MPDITPGQVAHAAYVAAEHGGSVPPERVATRWRCLLPSEQRGWEAAAQAVLEGCAMLCPICGAELERCNAKDPL